jgi:hypothetical protein
VVGEAGDEAVDALEGVDGVEGERKGEAAALSVAAVMLVFALDEPGLAAAPDPAVNPPPPSASSATNAATVASLRPGLVVDGLRITRFAG